MTMPYAGASDPKLPKNVLEMDAESRARWVAVFNSVLEKTRDEMEAFRQANGVVKTSAVLAEFRSASLAGKKGA